MNILKKIQKDEESDKATAFQRVDEEEEKKSKKEKQRIKKELQNVKTDVRSFYQEVLSTRDLLNQAGEEAKDGKLNFNILKKEFLEKLKKIQDDVLEIYSDLVLLSPPKAEAEEIKEQEEGEKAEKAEDLDRDWETLFLEY